MEKATREPLLHVRFTNEFTAVQVEGELDDPSSFGITLMTAIRSVQNSADILSLGAIKSVRGLDCDAGFHLQLDDAGHNLKKFPQVVQWSDLETSGSTQRRLYPVLPATDDLTGWLDQLTTAIRWRGLRTQTDDEWSHHFNDAQLKEDDIAKLALSILQFDLLMRSLNLPRRQLQIQFAQSIVWSAVNTDSDFLLALSRTPIPPASQSTIERCLSFFTWPV